MNAVIYARYSSDNQREESIEGQLRECKAFAKAKGLQIVGTYIDRALSAKTDNRPQFQKMIRDSAQKKFELVIVWKLDRFSRNRYDSARYKAALKKNGVRVVSATEAISEGAEGILLEALLEGMAEYYSADLGEKVLRGMTDNALKCKYNGGGVLVGYAIDAEQHFQIDRWSHRSSWRCSESMQTAVRSRISSLNSKAKACGPQRAIPTTTNPWQGCCATAAI